MYISYPLFHGPIEGKLDKGRLRATLKACWVGGEEVRHPALSTSPAPALASLQPPADTDA